MTSTHELEDGFYWVSLGDKWVVAQWSAYAKCFYPAGYMAKFYPYHFDEIDPRPIKRENVK